MGGQAVATYSDLYRVTCSGLSASVLAVDSWKALSAVVALSTRTYLQQARELAVAEVHVLSAAAALLAECIDAVAQGQQGAVDVCALLHSLASVLSLSREARLNTD